MFEVQRSPFKYVHLCRQVGSANAAKSCIQNISIPVLDVFISIMIQVASILITTNARV